MGMIKEFKDFAVKGNVADMAVGIIIGAAFGKIVSSLVKDVIMPPIGLMLSGVDFTEKKVVLQEAAEGVEAVTLNYGLFVNEIINFSIVAFAVFMLVKALNAAKKKEEEAPAAPAAPPAQEVLLTEIRDLLKSK